MREVVVVFEFELGEAGGEAGEGGAVEVVGRYTGVEGLNALEALRGQGQVGAEHALEAGEEEGSADVGEEADCRFGHREEGAFRGDADGRVDGQPDAAAHGDPVHVCNVGLRVGGDQMVQLVFQAKVRL